MTQNKKVQPAEWARKLATERLRAEVNEKVLRSSRYPYKPAEWLVSFVAEMIEKTEQPPVDPDEVVVNGIINAWNGFNYPLEHRKGHWPVLFNRAVERYKKLKEEER